MLRKPIDCRFWLAEELKRIPCLTGSLYILGPFKTKLFANTIYWLVIICYIYILEKSENIKGV
jgi:hypothetical protein